MATLKAWQACLSRAARDGAPFLAGLPGSRAAPDSKLQLVKHRRLYKFQVLKGCYKPKFKEIAHDDFKGMRSTRDKI